MSKNNMTDRICRAPQGEQDHKMYQVSTLQALALGYSRA